MDIKIYKTDTCPACKTLVGMIPEGVPYELINISKIPSAKPQEMNGAPYITVDGKGLSNAFALMDIIKKGK